MACDGWPHWIGLGRGVDEEGGGAARAMRRREYTARACCQGGQPVQGCPGSITEGSGIDVSARHSERKVGVLIAEARGTPARRDRSASVGNRDPHAPEVRATGPQTASPERGLRQAAQAIAVHPRCGISGCAVVCLCAILLEVHTAPAVGPVSVTVTRVWSDSNSCIT